jgi:DNA polymerase-3 subunit delta
MLYIFYGPDSFSLRESLNALKAELDEDGSLAANTVRLDARDTTPEEVMAACDTVPFLAQRRLVIVQGLLQTVARRFQEADGDDAPANVGRWQTLVEYIDRMPLTTVLALIDGDVSVKNVLLRALRPRAEVRAFPMLSPRELPDWIQARARALGLKLESAAVRVLAELVGNDLWQLSNELAKLAAYAGGGVVGDEAVRSMVSAAREQRGYLLADAVADRRGAHALKLLQELLAGGVPAAQLLATIQGRYRRLAVAREMLDQGASAGAIGERLGASGYALERLLEQAERHSLPSIRCAYARLLEADADVKLGYYDYDLALELLVHDLAMARK